MKRLSLIKGLTTAFGKKKTQVLTEKAAAHPAELLKFKKVYVNHFSETQTGVFYKCICLKFLEFRRRKNILVLLDKINTLKYFPCKSSVRKK